VAQIDFDAVGAQILDGLRAVAKPHLGDFAQWAAEDKAWITDQAKVSERLLRDLAHCVVAGDTEGQQTIRDAMDQHLSTLQLRWVRRRIEASRAADEAVGEAIAAGLKIALKVGLTLLTGGLA
jgi:hypothetical protein